MTFIWLQVYILLSFLNKFRSFSISYKDKIRLGRVNFNSLNDLEQNSFKYNESLIKHK